MDRKELEKLVYFEESETLMPSEIEEFANEILEELEKEREEVKALNKIKRGLSEDE